MTLLLNRRRSILDFGPRLFVTGSPIEQRATVAEGLRTRSSKGAAMAEINHIRNPVEWIADAFAETVRFVGRAARSLRLPEETRSSALPDIRKIETADLRDALAKGYDDLGAYRMDAVFLSIIYPIAGLTLVWVALDRNMIALLFPLASGFALIGPVAALGLYELSRRREHTEGGTMAGAPAWGGIFVLGLLLFAILLLWLATAYAIYLVTLGPEPPASVAAFARDVFTTEAGWVMIVAGVGVGFLFAVLVLTISVISFPLMLDRGAGPYTAVATSVRTVIANPVPMAAWGMIVAGSLLIGSLPALIGLVVVMPLLGHATWHLYRKVVPR
jgi:uncharacterized membrane protein